VMIDDLDRESRRGTRTNDTSLRQTANEIT
jgi:hypothetical protein